MQFFLCGFNQIAVAAKVEKKNSHTIKSSYVELESASTQTDDNAQATDRESNDF